jgi:hypothetical protein
MPGAISVRTARAAAVDLALLLDAVPGITTSPPIDDGDGSGISLDATLNREATAGATATVRLFFEGGDARLRLAEALAAIDDDIVIADAASEHPLMTIDAAADAGELDALLKRLDSVG